MAWPTQGVWILYTEVAYHQPKSIDARAIAAAWDALKNTSPLPLLGR